MFPHLVKITDSQLFSSFRSDRCLKLNWPMDLKADFFVHSDEIQRANEVSLSSIPLPTKPKEEVKASENIPDSSVL